MQRIRYEEFYPSEITGMMQSKPLAVVPLGLLEWHGEHLPLGQDGLKAQALCEMLVRSLGYGVVLPVFWWCRPGFSTFEGTLTFSASAVEHMLYELLGQMQKIGAKVIVMMTGHYGGCQVETVKRVAETYMHENPGVTVIAGPEYEDVLVDGESPADHAGKWETSLFNYFYPELTRMEAFKGGAETIKQYQNPPHNYYHESPVWQWRSNLADPAVASPGRGQRAAEAITAVWAEKVETTMKSLIDRG
jgi:creatinine amidohydrolase